MKTIIIYQSDTVPVEIAATYLQPKDTIAQRNAAMTGEKTSDQYRTFTIPAKFENPGIYIYLISDDLLTFSILFFI
jgi:hypothetical protein